MGYLVAKIIVLLVLAAALGFWLAHWWLRRRYLDVTEEYARLVDASAAGAATTGEGIRTIDERLGRLEGVEERLGAAFGERLSALERTILPPLSGLADLGSLSQRLEALESSVARFGIPDLDPIEARLAGLSSIDARLSGLERQLGALAAPRAPDFGPVTQRLESLAAAIGDRLLSFEERLDSLAPEPADLGPLTRRLDSLATVIAERMAALEQRMDSSSREPVDLGPLAERLEAMETAVADIPVPDLRPLEVRLGVLGAIADRLEAMSHSVEKLTPVPVDLSPVNRRIEALAGAVGDRLSSLEQTLVSREPRPADLGPIEARLDAITDGIRAIGPPAEGTPAPDLGWVHDRLHGLEQQLGALRGLLEGMTARSVPTVALAGSRNLLRRPVYGPPDDLKRIRGVGEALERLLHRIGVYYFWQVAEWDQSDVRFVDAHLDIFKGRIERDRWVEQAQGFAGDPGSASRPDSLEPPPGDADP